MTVVGAASFSSSSDGGATGTSSRGGRFSATYCDVVGLIESNACCGAHGFTQLVCHILEGEGRKDGRERERGRERVRGRGEEGRERERKKEREGEGGRPAACTSS